MDYYPAHRYVPEPTLQNVVRVGAAVGTGYVMNVDPYKVGMNAYKAGKYVYKGGKSAYKDYMSTPNKGGAAPLKGKSQRRKKVRTHCKGVKGKAGKEICSIKKAIKELRYSENASLGQMTYRDLVVGRILSFNNKQKVSNQAGSTTTSMESTLAFLKFFDPNNGETLLTADGGAGTYQREYRFKSVTSNILLRNNYQSDAKLKVYLCKPKIDSSTSPGAAWTNGIVDNGNVTDKDDLNQFASDYDVFRDIWSAKLLGKFTLSPGQSTSVSHTEKDIIFDPATIDGISETYQKAMKSFTFLVVLEGTLSHDTISDQQGIAAAGVDYIKKTTYVVSYDAGANISYVHLASSLDTPSNVFVQSHQPIPQNISYKVG